MFKKNWGSKRSSWCDWVCACASTHACVAEWCHGIKKYIKELINFIFKCTQFVESTQNRGSADGEERQKLLWASSPSSVQNARGGKRQGWHCCPWAQRGWRDQIPSLRKFCSGICNPDPPLLHYFLVKRAQTQEPPQQWVVHIFSEMPCEHFLFSKKKKKKYYFYNQINKQWGKKMFHHLPFVMTETEVQKEL